VLIDYYVYRECIKLLIFGTQYLRVFEGGLEAWVGALISVLLFEASKLGCSSSGDPYRSKVAEEMLLCGHRSVQDMPKHYEENLLMRVRAAGLRSFFLWRGSCRRTASISSAYV
jgi:hypothetical protein